MKISKQRAKGSFILISVFFRNGKFSEVLYPKIGNLYIHSYVKIIEIFLHRLTLRYCFEEVNKSECYTIEKYLKNFNIGVSLLCKNMRYFKRDLFWGR